MAALVVFLLLMPIPYKGRVAVAMGDLVHTPLFASITLIVLSVLHRLRPIAVFGGTLITRFAIVFIVLACFGAGMEVAQETMGRTGSLHDALANCYGIVVGILVFGWWVLRRADTAKTARWCLLVIAAATFVLGWLGPIAMLRDVAAVYRDFPLLASFESDVELQRWYFNNCTGEITTRGVTDGEAALEVSFTNQQHASVTAIEMQRDWTSMADLQFDVVLDAAYPENGNLIVKVIDRVHISDADMYVQKVSLVPGQATHFRITRDEIVNGPDDREIDLSQIRYFELILDSPVTATKLRVDHVRLTLQ